MPINLHVERTSLPPCAYAPPPPPPAPLHTRPKYYVVQRARQQRQQQACAHSTHTHPFISTRRSASDFVFMQATIHPPRTHVLYGCGRGAAQGGGGRRARSVAAAAESCSCLAVPPLWAVLDAQRSSNCARVCAQTGGVGGKAGVKGGCVWQWARGASGGFRV